MCDFSRRYPPGSGVRGAATIRGESSIVYRYVGADSLHGAAWEDDSLSEGHGWGRVPEGTWQPMTLPWSKEFPELLCPALQTGRTVRRTVLRTGTVKRTQRVGMENEANQLGPGAWPDTLIIFWARLSRCWPTLSLERISLAPEVRAATYCKRG